MKILSHPKMSLGCLILGRECAEENKDASRDRRQLEQVPTGDIQDTLNSKINDSNGLPNGKENKNP